MCSPSEFREAKEKFNSVLSLGQSLGWNSEKFQDLIRVLQLNNQLSVSPTLFRDSRWEQGKYLPKTKGMPSTNRGKLLLPSHLYHFLQNSCPPMNDVKIVEKALRDIEREKQTPLPAFTRNCNPQEMKELIQAIQSQSLSGTDLAAILDILHWSGKIPTYNRKDFRVGNLTDVNQHVPQWFSKTLKSIGNTNIKPSLLKYILTQDCSELKQIIQKVLDVKKMIRSTPPTQRLTRNVSEGKGTKQKIVSTKIEVLPPPPSSEEIKSKINPEELLLAHLIPSSTTSPSLEELQVEKIYLSFECIPYFMSFPFSTRLFNSPSIRSFSACELSTQEDIYELFNAFLQTLWKSNKTIQIRLTTPTEKNPEIPKWNTIEWKSIIILQVLQEGKGKELKVKQVLHLTKTQTTSPPSPILIGDKSQNHLIMEIQISSPIFASIYSSQLLEMQLFFFDEFQYQITLSVLLQNNVLRTEFDMKLPLPQSRNACLPHEFVDMSSSKCTPCDFKLLSEWIPNLSNNLDIRRIYLGPLANEYKPFPDSNLTCSFLRKNYLNLAPSYTLESKCSQRENLFKYYENSCYADSTLVALFIHPNDQISYLLEHKQVAIKEHDYYLYTKFFVKEAEGEVNTLQLTTGDQMSDAQLDAFLILNRFVETKNFYQFKQEQKSSTNAILKEYNFVRRAEILIENILQALKNARDLIQGNRRPITEERCTNIRLSLMNLYPSAEEKNPLELGTVDPSEFLEKICQFLGLNLPINFLRPQAPTTIKELINENFKDFKGFLTTYGKDRFLSFSSPGLNWLGGIETKGAALFPEMTLEIENLKWQLGSVIIYQFNHYALYYKCPMNKDLWWFYDTKSERPIEAARYSDLLNYFSTYGTIFFYEN